MKKATKIWLVIAASLILIGFIMFISVMNQYKWDFTMLSTRTFETNDYELTEDFHSISIETSTANIQILPYNDGKCKVVCFEDIKSKHSVIVQEDTLVINEIDTRSWYDHIGINFRSPAITIYLPKTEYDSIRIRDNTGKIEISNEFTLNSMEISSNTGNVKVFASVAELLKIKTTTGKIQVENLSAGTVDLTVSTGEVTVSNITCTEDVKIIVSTGKAKINKVTCKNLISKGNTGDIILNNVVASESFSIQRSTGCVKFENSDAAEIFATTDTGDITGTLLSDKVFIPKTDTGRIDVPKTSTGGKCELTTDTGNIKITILN